MRKRRVKRVKPETVLTSRVANFLRLAYPTVIFRFDLAADMPLPMVHAKRNKELHGKFSRGYPDVFIAVGTKKFGGLYLELKATATVPNTEHTRRQAYIHQLLRGFGFKVEFCCGYEDCISRLRKYLKNV